MAELVVDSSVWIASLLEEDVLHDRAVQFIEEFGRGDHSCHLPRLVLVETCARVGLKAGLDKAMGVRGFFTQWVQRGQLRLYDLDDTPTQSAVSAALLYGLRGADAIVVSLGDELSFPVLTFDSDILRGYPRARTP